MAQREPSAAQALYPNLKQGTPEPVQQRRTPTSLADALYPKPPPPTYSELRKMWSDHLLALAGLRRKK